MFFAPAKPGWNVTASFTVAVLPEVLALEPVPVIVHWLFWRVAEVPSVIGPR